MENQRTFLIIALLAVSAVLYQKWIEFSNPEQGNTATQILNQTDNAVPGQTNLATLEEGLPSTPIAAILSTPTLLPATDLQTKTRVGTIITVETDTVIAKINTQGGVIESLELLKEPIAVDKKDQGFPLLKNNALETFITQDGLLARGGQIAPNHTQTLYQAAQTNYQLGDSEKVEIPLSWVADSGVQYTKTLTFKRDSYVVDIDYKIVNATNAVWQGYIYAQFSRSEPPDSGGSFGQLPSFTGGATYTAEDKYQKIKFKDMGKDSIAIKTESGWVAMLQHYFVGAWIPHNGGAKQFYSSSNKSQSNPIYRLGYKTLQPTQVDVGQTGNIRTSVYLGPKQQSRLKNIEATAKIEGLALTVDYGFLTFIADPLFVALSWIHSLVGNWGWAIILLTLLIKILFYPLSAASYKSMAGMKKLQPRIQTLKERYKDDRQKFQMEMMALYKKEKINPAGGCLPILIQIPVFIALYWALLESVEIRQAPFALWLQDLSAPDPFYILPVLMGLSMWAQQKLNPAPMDDIQKKVMAIMPIALTFLFLTFPQGLVLYWVVNNVLSMAQQWLINKKYAS